jgi:rhomboid protease GluP
MPEMIVFLRSRQKSLMLDFSLVLASQDLEHEVDFDGERYLIWMSQEKLAVAREILHAYVRENRNFHTEIEAPKLDMLVTPFVYLIWPTAFHFWVRLSAWPAWWVQQGAADARRILAGEWWRTLTATTLHADHPHFLSNLFSGYFMLNLLGHRLGIGLILFLGVTTSMIANFLVALTSPLNHISLGFSTTVFSILGILAGVETLHRPATDGLHFRRINPLLAAFAVALLVGIGEDVDIKAHFFGFALGAAAGLLTHFLPKQIARWPAQIALGGFAYALYALSWIMATGQLRF